jgi:hypothetical protein
MEKPTQIAEEKFRRAQSSITQAVLLTNDPGVTYQLAGLSHLSEGLLNLSIGVRATYILLEQVKGMLERQGQVRR